MVHVGVLQEHDDRPMVFEMVMGKVQEAYEK